MNNDPHITLNDIFSTEKDKYHSRFVIAEPSNKISVIKEKVLKEEQVGWPVVSSKIGEKIEDLLNIPIADILTMAWKKYKILLKYLDSEKYPPDETYIVDLTQHTIKSEHHPYLEIWINEQYQGKIEFNINVSIMLKGIVLKIQAGRIKEITTGNIKGMGTIKCEDFVILEKETETFTFPGSIKLGDGIPIAG